jgi:putative YhbY family RNA-binding protein
MPEIALTPKERQALKAQAHGLNPVVLLGAAGLSAAALKEIDRALAAHELIKVRVPGDDREERDALFAEVAESLSAARVQAIGKLLVFFRPAPEETAAPRATVPAAPRDAGRTPRSPKAPARPPRAAKAPPRAGKPSAPKRTTADRREAERVNRTPAPRRDPGAASRAAGRRNTTRRGTGRTR